MKAAQGGGDGTAPAPPPGEGRVKFLRAGLKLRNNLKQSA